MPSLILPRDHRILFRSVLISLIAVIVMAEPLLIWPAFKKLSGRGINWRAWRASYRERHLTIPPSGEPRDGIWGSHLPPRHDPVLGPVLPERHVPGMFEIDQYGRQHAISHQPPKLRLMIIGGSVAAGAYASNLNRTYFSQLAWRLEHNGYPVEIAVQAAGSWTSENELAAFQRYAVELKPDAIIFLDGLNDLTLYPERHGRATLYLSRMKEMRRIAMEHHIKVIFAPQPFLPQKRHKTALEMIIQVESVRPLDRLLRGYTKLRAGLQALCVPHQVYYMDCSGAFDRTRFTTFTDIWHFSDVGHARLAEYMTLKLDPILRDVETQKGILPPQLAMQPPRQSSPYFHF